MPLARYEIKPGVQSQATQVQAEGAWFASNRIRWRNGLLEKMGGWLRLFQPASSAIVRRMHAWQDLLNVRTLAVGTDAGIDLWYDPTPTAFAQAIALGEPQQNTWYLGNQGQNGLALRTGSQLLVYNPPSVPPPVGPNYWTSPGTPTTVPQHSAGMCSAMPQAQVIVWGTESVMGTASSVDPLLLRWSDAGGYGLLPSDWTASVSSMAGTFRLSSGSKIMRVLQAPQAMLILSDTDLWTMSFIGLPLVYGFTVISAGCGLIAPHAFAILGNTTFWLARKNVWAFGPGSAQIVPCSVWDYFFENLDTINEYKCHGAANSTTGEVAFYFPYKGDVFPPGKNSFSYSQDFTQAIWQKTAVTVAIGSPLAPDATSTSNTLTETAVTSVHEVLETLKKFNDLMTFTLSIYAHVSSTRNLACSIDVGRGAIGCQAIFNPTTGALVSTGATAPFTITQTNIGVDSFATGLSGNGWLRYSMTFVTDDATLLNMHIGLANGTAQSYLGSGGKLVLWGAQLDIGGQALPYSVTTTVKENECTRYIKFNTIERAWDSGILTRSAWLDSSVWGTPIGADENTYIQQHERGYDADGAPMAGVFAEAGYTQIGDGSQMMSIHQCHPDFKWAGKSGEVQLRFKAKNYPGDEGDTESKVNTYGPFSMTPNTRFFDPRLRGRYVAIRYDWSPILGFSARVGAVRYRIKPTGRRP
jgi:hypothetical protein